MSLVRLLWIAPILLFPLAASADGNKFLEQCQAAESFLDKKQSRNETSAAYCFGLLEGVRETMQYLNELLEPRARVVCWPPKGINNAQSVRVVLKYMRDNPNKLHEDPVFLTMMSFRDAFPCK